jgi:hypothetical protein
MSTFTRTCLILAATGCASPRPIDPGHNRPLSAQEHLTEAERHDREANAQGASYDPEARVPRGAPGAPIECFDRPLAGMPHSGTEPLPLVRPCWSTHTAAIGDREKVARVHRHAAAEHRGMAAVLFRVEREACAGLGEDEISHSPFYHREDILQVEPIHEDGALRGARVTFRPVPGLTLKWLRTSVDCHLARAAVMGYSSRYMSYCPLMLEGVTAEVERLEYGFRVTVRARSDEIAAAVLGRVRDLLQPAPDSPAP